MTPPDSHSSDPTDAWRRRSDVRFRIIDREAVVLRQEAGETLVLNEVGARILQMIDGGDSLAAIAGTLVEEFEVAPEQAELDAGAFITELIDSGVIEAAGS